MNPADLFEPEGLPVDNGDLNPVDLIAIDDITDEAKKIAIKLVNKVKKIYFTNSELKDDGYANTIIERAISSISLLEKMLLSNSQIQDRLITNICLNSENSGLYMSLTRIQDAIMDIQTQISKELQALHEDLNEIKNADIEDDDEPVKEPEVKTAFRGSKDFLKSMIDEDDEDA